ncbi:hypothetical protein A9977_12220 [Variovorax sp. UMC13]|nr:hypothetical protein [Variovorax sp. UMC13]
MRHASTPFPDTRSNPDVDASGQAQRARRRQMLAEVGVPILAPMFFEVVLAGTAVVGLLFIEDSWRCVRRRVRPPKRPRAAGVERVGYVRCRLKRMRIGPLYEQAVDLSPRAARIAAALLVKEATLPEPLRRSLAIALSACGGSAQGADDMPMARQAGLGGEDREARAAARFVEACRALCARG